MMKLRFFILLVAIILSSISAFYSVVGLIAIYPAKAFMIGIMGASLEAAKVVGTLWLHQNWNKSIHWLKKWMLVFWVSVIVFLNACGVFGFLSAAHLEQESKQIQGVAVESLDLQLRNIEDQIEVDKTQLKQIDSAVDRMIQLGRTSGALQSRSKLSKEKTDTLAHIQQLEESRAKLEEQKRVSLQEKKKLELEVGPLRYISQLIYGQNATDETLEKSVRLLNLLIVCVLDPMALMLMIIGTGETQRNESTTPNEPNNHPPRKSKVPRRKYIRRYAVMDPDPSNKSKAEVELTVGNKQDDVRIETPISGEGSLSDSEARKQLNTGII